MIKQFTAFFLCLLFSPIVLLAQNEYSNYRQQTERIRFLAGKYPQLVKVSSLTKTAAGKDIWMITLGGPASEGKPAIAVVGGIEGKHLLGTELALGFAEYLLKNSKADSIGNVLTNTTIYVFPNMSPDAMEQYFGTVKYERNGNGVPADDDRDGRVDEDGFEDIDGDGKITWMRIESPLGNYKTSTDDERVLVKADLSKGEKGRYLLLREGTDNDKDGQFNEDGPGGIWFNKNLPFKHPSFTAGAGEFPVSERETRALLDTLYKLFNVYAVVGFGPDDNLSVPIAYNAAAAGQRLVTGYLEPDAKSNAMISGLYNSLVDNKDAPKTSPAGGDFLSWAYYNYGRFAFSTPAWFVPRYKPDTAKKEKAIAGEDSVMNYLKWAGQKGITNTFTGWKMVSHPDFPNQKVEVGGLDPFVLVNPPFKMVPDIQQKHTDFLLKLIALQPRIDITDTRSEKLGSDVTRVTVKLANKGALPSFSKMGERNYWVKRIHVRLHTANSQLLISGRKSQLVEALDGFGSQTLSWLIKGGGKCKIEAGSPTTGTKTIEIAL